jgi:hypothetical protein
MAMDVRDVAKLARNVSNNVRENLLKNRMAQNKMDSENLDKADKNIQDTKTTEVKTAKDLLASQPQSTAILSDPKEDAMRKLLIFTDPSKSISNT